jgi:hypothetical protein
MIEQSQQFLRSYMPTNTQKQNETVSSVMVQNAQGKNEMQFQLQPDNVSATGDMEFPSEVMPTESVEAVVGQQLSISELGHGEDRQGLPDSGQCMQSQGSQKFFSEVPL